MKGNKFVEVPCPKFIVDNQAFCNQDLQMKRCLRMNPHKFSNQGVCNRAKECVL